LIDLVEICKTAAKLTEKGTKDRSFEMWKNCLKQKS
jgi:hypothetical protein